MAALAVLFYDINEFIRLSKVLYPGYWYVDLISKAIRLKIAAGENWKALYDLGSDGAKNVDIGFRSMGYTTLGSAVCGHLLTNIYKYNMDAYNRCKFIHCPHTASASQPSTSSGFIGGMSSDSAQAGPQAAWAGPRAILTGAMFWSLYQALGGPRTGLLGFWSFGAGVKKYRAGPGATTIYL